MENLNSNVFLCDPTDKNNRMLNFKLKNINNKINEQKCHIEQLKGAIACKETDNLMLEKRLNTLQKLHVNRIKEIEEQTKKMEQVQKSVWNERNVLEAKIKKIQNQVDDDLQSNSSASPSTISTTNSSATTAATSSANVSLKETLKLNGRKNGLKNYLSKTDEELLKLKNRIDDIKKDKDTLLKTVKEIL